MLYGNKGKQCRLLQRVASQVSWKKPLVQPRTVHRLLMDLLAKFAEVCHVALMNSAGPSAPTLFVLVEIVHLLRKPSMIGGRSQG